MKNWKELCDWQGRPYGDGSQWLDAIEIGDTTISASIGSYLANKGPLRQWKYSVRYKIAGEFIKREEYGILTEAEAKQKANAIIDEIIAQNT